MYDRTYYATHPDMMECVSNDELRDRYLIQGLFRDGEQQVWRTAKRVRRYGVTVAVCNTSAAQARLCGLCALPDPLSVEGDLR